MFIMSRMKDGGTVFSRHAVNTSLYALSSAILAGDVLENTMVLMKDSGTVFSRHAVNTSLYALSPAILAGDILTNTVPLSFCRHC